MNKNAQTKPAQPADLSESTASLHDIMLFMKAFCEAEESARARVMRFCMLDDEGREKMALEMGL